MLNKDFKQIVIAPAVGDPCYVVYIVMKIVYEDIRVLINK